MRKKLLTLIICMVLSSISVYFISSSGSELFAYHPNTIIALTVVIFMFVSQFIVSKSPLFKEKKND